MSFSPDTLRKHLSSHGDLAKPSRFRVKITGSLREDGSPSTIGLDTSRELQLQCEATELPGFTINTSESKIYGPSWHVATIPVFNEISLTFICAQDMWEKKFFDTWMRSIIPISKYQSPEVAPHAEYRDNYRSTIFIEQMTDVNPVLSIYRCVLEDAFPTSTSPLPVNWGDVDGVHRLQVSFKYTKWKPYDTDFSLTDYAQRYNKSPETPPAINVLDGPINIQDSKIEPDFIDPFVTPPRNIPTGDFNF